MCAGEVRLPVLRVPFRRRLGLTPATTAGRTQLSLLTTAAAGTAAAVSASRLLVRQRRSRRTAASRGRNRLRCARSHRWARPILMVKSTVVVMNKFVLVVMSPWCQSALLFVLHAAAPGRGTVSSAAQIIAQV